MASSRQPNFGTSNFKLLPSLRRVQSGVPKTAGGTAAIGQSREMAEAGCLMNYGIRLTDPYVIAARLTDKMLRGAQAGETPAEQPNKFELVINLKTAQALGLVVPE